MSIFCERLVKARKNINLTQKHLAEILQITPTRLNFWEKGKREPDIKMIFKLADTLNVSSDYLIGLVNSPNETYTPAPEDTIELKQDEKQLVTDYRSLNPENKNKVREYVSDLNKIEKCGM